MISGPGMGPCQLSLPSQMILHLDLENPLGSVDSQHFVCGWVCSALPHLFIFYFFKSMDDFGNCLFRQ